MLRLASQEELVSGDFRVGAWLARPSLNTISKNGTDVRVEPKVMEVLVCLASCPGESISKETILKTVWPDTFVSDDALIRAISELRKAFGDDASKPRVIETIPKKGYRLLLPVTLLSRRELLDRLHLGVIDSIAVLPFENVDPDPEMEYLSEGVAETILDSLSRLQDVRVVPRTTSFQYKRKPLDPVRVGHKLGARLVLTGQVGRRNDHVIVGAELTDTERESQIWCQTYDRKMEAIFAIQEEIAAKIPNYLHLRSAEVDKHQVARRSTESREAYHFYLKAIYFANKYTSDGLRKGLDYCGHAIEADPVYAEAYAALSYLYSLMGAFEVVPAVEAFPRARAAALKALEIDEGLANAHAILGFVQLAHDWDWGCAKAEICRAIDLGPHMPGGHYAYSHWWLGKGHYKEALEEARHTIDLDPLSLPSNYHLGAVYYFANEYDAAIEQLRRTIELDQSFVRAQNLLAVVYGKKGMSREAIEEAEKTRALSDRPYTRLTFGRISAMIGNLTEARQILAEVEQVSKPPYFPRAYWCAMIHALLGERDSVFEWLDKAYAAREPALIFLTQAPDFESLHDDPRFRELARRVGLAA
jgi:TolB-like protein